MSNETQHPEPRAKYDGSEPRDGRGNVIQPPPPTLKSFDEPNPEYIGTGKSTPAHDGITIIKQGPNAGKPKYSADSLVTDWFDTHPKDAPRTSGNCDCNGKRLGRG
jgi:hypothetical protein